MRKPLFLTVAVAALSLSACASAPTAQEIANADYGRAMTQEECESTVKATIGTYLKDPTSAQYQFGTCGKGWAPSVPVASLPKQFGYRLSASINAKNSFGGYTGYKPYDFLMKDGVMLRKSKQMDDYNVMMPF